MPFFVAFVLALFVPTAIASRWRPVQTLRSPVTIAALVCAVIGVSALISRGNPPVSVAFCVPILQLALAKGYYIAFVRMVGRAPVDIRQRIFSASDLPIEDFFGGAFLNLVLFMLALAVIPWQAL
jgi:hypothetical protein